MKPFSIAAHKHGRIVGLLSLLLLFFLLALNSNSALAATLAVSLRQINPNSQVQQFTCTSNQECQLPIAMTAAAPEAGSLTVKLTYASDNVIARFHIPTGTLMAAESGHYFPIWHKPVPTTGPSTFDITLYLPGGTAAAPTYQAVADIELTVQPTP